MDPNKRWSCEQLLEHAYFDNYLIDNKREENKPKAYQAKTMFQQTEGRTKIGGGVRCSKAFNHDFNFTKKLSLQSFN
jgi:hypothetical protein